MMYRVAIERISPQGWRWTSTILSSLDALFHFLRLYPNVQLNRLRVFSASTCEDLNGQLKQENEGLPSNSVTANQFLRKHMLCVPETINEFKQNRTYPTCTFSSESSNNLDKTGMNFLDKRRIELEFGPGGDHDCPYTFSVPTSTSLVLTWRELLLRIQNGVLQP